MTILKILTWNIWLMPAWLPQGGSPLNLSRAHAIAQELAARDFDILCLEKAFDDEARKRLGEELLQRYPNQYGPANPGDSAKPVNSGVWLLSRQPLAEGRTIEFRDCAGIECFSRKGAMLMSGEAAGHPYQILATHLQGDSGSAPPREYADIRTRQLEQIREELLVPHARPGVPLFLCGDLHVSRRAAPDSAEESSDYREMLRILGAENGPGDRITLDETGRNDLEMARTGVSAEMDYVLVRSGGVPLRTDWSRLILRRRGWDTNLNRQDLSYRYAVALTAAFPEPAPAAPASGR